MNPTGIALDRTGRIYVTNAGTASDTMLPAPTLTVYAPDAAGDAAPIRTIAGPATRLGGPAAVAVADDGTLYVANSTVIPDDLGSVTIHAAAATGDRPPLTTLTGPAGGIRAPLALAVGPADTLYALMASGSSREVKVYPPRASPGTPPVRTLRTASYFRTDLRAMAVDAAGSIYLANMLSANGVNAYGADMGEIRVYRAGALSDSLPLRIINGAMTRLNGPIALAVDRAGNVYAANYWGAGSGSVTVYGPGTEEDVRPLRMIVGPATGLNKPYALALDRADTLYVANERSVTVFAPGASGDVPPLRTLELGADH